MKTQNTLFGVLRAKFRNEDSLFWGIFLWNRKQRLLSYNETALCFPDILINNNIRFF